MSKVGEENIQLKNKIKELEDQLNIKKELLVLFDEAVPVAENERKRYVSDIALFYNTVFKEKLKHFKGEQLKELAMIGRTELSSNIIRSNINCFHLIDEWMSTKTNEHLGNLQEMRNTFKSDEEFTNKFKETYHVD